MRRAYIELLRPANVVTAIADVLAGFAIAGLRHPDTLPWLILSSCCLYAGGVVLNDVFDRDLDRIERPERPIPSGRVSTPRRPRSGRGLLAAGVAAARSRHSRPAASRWRSPSLVLLYDAWGKRQAPIAPLNMALCRALNLLLGVAAVPAALVGGVANRRGAAALHRRGHVLSRGEVHGGSSPRRVVCVDNLGDGDRRPGRW